MGSLQDGTQALAEPPDYPQTASFMSVVQFLGPCQLSRAALHFGLSDENTEEMLSKWTSAVMLSESGHARNTGPKQLLFTLRNVFQHVQGDWLREVFVLMGHERSEALATNVPQLIRAIVAHILEGLPFPHQVADAESQDVAGRSQNPDDSFEAAPPTKRIKLTVGNRVLVLPRTADWLLNLCIDPLLMQLSPLELKRVMATCKQLRVMVHRFAKFMIFTPKPEFADEYELFLLGKGQWHGLKVLELQYTVGAAQMCQLVMGQLPQLSSLKLTLPFCTSTAMQLADGKWPLLQQLNLSNSRLTSSAMAAIKRGKWPALKELVLHSCNLDCQDFFHITTAIWHQLELIDLYGNDLDGKDLTNLSIREWPSLKSLHAGNIMKPAAMTRLLAGQRPQLEALTFAAKWPSVPSTVGFPQGPVYAIGPLRGLPAVKHCQIHQPQLCQSLAACIVSSWQANLHSLDLLGCDITGAALQPFAQAHWRCLKWLRLSSTAIDAEGFGHIVTAKMPQLQHLRMEKCRGMDAAAFGQLSAS